MVSEVLFSSKDTTHRTPQWLFNNCNEVFNFEIDVAASDENALCAKYYTEAENGLLQGWAPYTVWCNPPYGRGVVEWVRKAYEESELGADVVMLLPSRTDTYWWHEYVEGKAEYRFIRGRLRFGLTTAGAPFPSVLISWGPRKHLLQRVRLPWPR